MSKIIIKSTQGILAAADSSANTAFTDVLGNKEDGASNTADTASLVALLRYAIANLGQASVLGAINDAALGKNSNDSGAESVIALLRSIVDRCGNVGGSDIYTDLAAVLVDTGTTLPATLGTPAGASMSADIAAVKADTAKLGTIANSGGTATIGAILGDFANVTLVTKLDDILARQSGAAGIASFPAAAAAANNVSLAEVIRYIQETQIGSLANTGGTATLAGILGDVNNVSVATSLAKLGTLTNSGGTATLGGILGDVSNVSIATRLGNINTDLGDPSARTNFQSIETMIGIPDAANSNLDDMLRTGYNSTAITPNADGSILERIEYVQGYIDGSIAHTNAIKREAGRTQVKAVTITSAANAGVTTIATITSQPCTIKSITLRSNGATTADLTSAAIKGGTSQVITFIAAGTATQSALSTADKQVAFTGAYTIPSSGTIAIDLQGTGGTAVALVATIEYFAVADGGYLA